MTDNSDRDVLRTALAREAVIPEKRRATTFAIRNAFLESHNDGRCAVCQADIWFLALPFEIDHILPLELGGHEGTSNLQALCIPCHKAKTRDDIKRIRKAARLRRDADPETRRRSARPLRGRGFQKADPMKTLDDDR